MSGDGSLTFREFIMREPLPLATIHDAVLEFLPAGMTRFSTGLRPSIPRWRSLAWLRTWTSPLREPRSLPESYKSS
jgi:hypothetical protein